ncbi:Cytochrome c [Intoshia linei]|uniref:Cytochrome c n=1 Tax=Intoshia linei TaxID=1819745 RepID=A0A177BBT9_9BILA|nr:Cytochrome c [Intoshia linei]
MSCDEGNSKKGKKIFQKLCATCHTTDKESPHKQGPNLHQVHGRQTGQAKDYDYTKANKDKGITWTDDNLFNYLKKPAAFIPGTKMVFVGIKSKKERQDLIAYLRECK